MRDRHKGFAKFIREVNPVNSTQSTRPTLPVEGVCLYSRSHLQAVCEGALDELTSAFEWSTAPQGNYYWFCRKTYREPMSPEDYEFCQQLLEYHS